MGYTCKKVAEKVGCSDDTVRKVLKAHDIKSEVGLLGKLINLIWLAIIYSTSGEEKKQLNGL